MLKFYHSRLKIKQHQNSLHFVALSFFTGSKNYLEDLYGDELPLVALEIKTLIPVHF